MDIQDRLRGAHRHQHMEHRHGRVRRGSERCQQRVGHRHSDTSLTFNEHIAGFEAKLAEMEVWSLLGLWLQTVVVHLSMWALTICIFIICYGRMIEIYCVTSIAPIPMATMVNREWGRWVRIISEACLRWAFRLSHHHLRGDLCHTDARHCSGEQRIRGHMDVHGVYGAAVLYAV